MTLAVDKKWINRLDPDEVILYPLQFANTERLNSHDNDAVYIFDEVGSGKTISSGIMALDFLEHNPSENVLVITTNALARSSEVKPRGQFLEDWFKKLPFEELGYGNRVRVVNNHHSKFKIQQKFGLVIIDEAHLFLGEWTQRYHNLTNNITAKKVVFLTATPIKQGVLDLHVYPRIASKLLGKPVDSSWIDQLRTINKQPSDLICSQFDVKFPVTRYFKDTIKSLETEGYNKTKVKRYESLVWEYSRSNKNEVLAEKLKSLYSENSKDNRFVVFTRYLVKEVDVIAGYLESAGFVKSNTELPDKPTYYVVTGRNPRELTDFSRSDNLPTVLILTYQIAEQGINLPGYNHIVNYHISAYPSALEQRYGRIDRLNSKSEKIFNCFLIGEKGVYDTNTLNFYYAIGTCLGSMLSYLPSRNTILSPDILKLYTTMKSDVERYLARLSESLYNQGVRELYDYLTAWEALQNKPVSESSESHDGEVALADTDSVESSEPLDEESFNSVLVLADVEQNELFMFCREELSLDQSLKGSRDDAEKALLEDIQKRIAEFRGDVLHKSDEKDKVIEWLSRDQGIWDHIFYINERSADWTQLDVDRVDAVEGCAKFISKKSDFVKYLEMFNEQIRLPKEFQKYRAPINKGYEKAFIANRFDVLFPDLVGSTYSEKFEVVLKASVEAEIEARAKAKKEANHEVIEGDNKISALVIENIDQLIPTLPLFKMMDQYKKELKKSAQIANGAMRDKFDGYDHVFALAMDRLRRRDLSVSDMFYAKYLGIVRVDEPYEPSGVFKQFFSVAFSEDVVEEGVTKKVSSASNWLKLAYHISRKESLSCVLKYVGGDKYWLQYIVDSASNSTAPSSGKVVSLFSYFVNTNSGGFRTWAKKQFVDDIAKPDFVWSNDYWTKGILREVKGWKYGN